MNRTSSETFQSAPLGNFCVIGSSFLWCAAPTLGGAVLWSRQSEAETTLILRTFDLAMQSMGPTFDVILDTRDVEAVDVLPLQVLFSWMVARMGELAQRLRLQACIIREGPIGLLLTGLMPVTGQVQPYRLFTDRAEAYRAVAGENGATLAAEIQSIAEQLRGVPRELRVVRELLQARLEVSLEDVCRELGMSSRSLQRALARHGTSLHDEVVAARLARAKTLLESGDLKLTEVGARLGISERALGLLFRAKTGLTPAEWRRRHRE